MNPMKRTSLIVYEADIFKCSQHSAPVWRWRPARGGGSAPLRAVPAAFQDSSAALCRRFSTHRCLRCLPPTKFVNKSHARAKIKREFAVPFMIRCLDGRTSQAKDKTAQTHRLFA